MEGKSSGASCSRLKLVAHPRAKSKVWKYFGFDTDADGCILHWKRIYCRVCMTQIAYSGNTSNLSYHLEKNHPVEYSELLKSNSTHQVREAFATAFYQIQSKPSGQLVPSQDSGLKQSLNDENRRHCDLTTAIMNFVCKGLYPASVVDEPCFKALMNTVDPGYSPPSTSEVALKILPQMYWCNRDVVFSETSGVLNCGVTTDLWQSHNRTYISLSLHSVYQNGSNNFVSINKCLKTFEVQEDNMAENITRSMFEAFDEWGITHKVIGATTNGSVDIGKACSLLELSVEMPCLGHTINLAMDNVFQLPQIESFLGCCRKLADHFKDRDIQSHHGQVPSAFVTDRGRSWLGTLAMLQRLKEEQIAVTAYLTASSSSHHFRIDSPNWGVLDGLIEVLQHFKVVADMFTSCRYPTISMVRPVLHMLLTSTLKLTEGDLKEISMAKEVLSRILSSTYSQNSQLSQDVSEFLNIATFLDPRYKKLPFLSAQQRAKVESSVIEEAKALLEKQNADRPCLDDFAEVSEEPPSKKVSLPRECATSTTAQDNPLAAIFCQFDADQNHEELHSQAIEELSNYKSQRVLGLNEDPLRWWSSHAALFPTLPKLLQRYWCIPATSVPCHRLFSPSGTALCGKRNRIASSLVDQQVFLYENLRSYYEPEPCGDLDNVRDPTCNLGGQSLQ
ncbi:E3 SUMO-protein ligase ZBED1-like [Neosynchiropus ocellatus]